jgi:hypothetical protein
MINSTNEQKKIQFSSFLLTFELLQTLNQKNYIKSQIFIHIFHQYIQIFINAIFVRIFRIFCIFFL